VSVETRRSAARRRRFHLSFAIEKGKECLALLLRIWTKVWAKSTFLLVIRQNLNVITASSHRCVCVADLIESRHTGSHVSIARHTMQAEARCLDWPGLTAVRQPFRSVFVTQPVPIKPGSKAREYMFWSLAKLVLSLSGQSIEPFSIAGELVRPRLQATNLVH
jgi:hypothetical protein